MKIKQILAWVMAAVLLCIPVMGVYASDGEEYITITVQAEDDNEGMTYALDSDAPGNFGPSNTFTVPAGTPHTIYVKDAAGNITSQVYEPPEPPEPETSGAVLAGGNDTYGEDSPPDTADQKDSSHDDVNVNGTYDGQTIDIDLELGKDQAGGDAKPYEIKRDTPAEQGEGTVYSKTFLDGTDSSEQVFYSMTTAEGSVYYLLIDQGQESNNVYLLNQVTNQDLKALAADDGTELPEDKDKGNDSLLKALAESEAAGTENNRAAAKGGVNRNAVILLVLMAAGGGFYYYQKVYKAKKEQEMDAMEAPDMDQFVTPGDGEEEFDFEYGDDDRDEYLRNLIREDEMEYAAAAENEAGISGWGTGADAGEPDADGPDNGDPGEGEPEEGSLDDIFTAPPADDIFNDMEELDSGYDPDLDGDDE